jgi:hypothetical protein
MIADLYKARIPHAGEDYSPDPLQLRNVRFQFNCIHTLLHTLTSLQVGSDICKLYLNDIELKLRFARFLRKHCTIAKFRMIYNSYSKLLKTRGRRSSDISLSG